MLQECAFYFQVANLPLQIKERDVKYQFSRIVLYRKLLQGYPFKRPLIWKEARMVSFINYHFRGNGWGWNR